METKYLNLKELSFDFRNQLLWKGGFARSCMLDLAKAYDLSFQEFSEYGDYDPYFCLILDEKLEKLLANSGIETRKEEILLSSCQPHEEIGFVRWKQGEEYFDIPCVACPMKGGKLTLGFNMDDIYEAVEPFYIPFVKKEDFGF